MTKYRLGYLPNRAETVADTIIKQIAKDPYISYVGSQVVKGIVKHEAVDPDWIKPRMTHIRAKYCVSDASAYEAVRLAEEIALVQA